MIAKLATGDAHKNFLCNSTLNQGRILRPRRIRPKHCGGQEPNPKIQAIWNLGIGIWNLSRQRRDHGPLAQLARAQC